MRVEWTELARSLQQMAGNAAIIAFVLAVVLVFPGAGRVGTSWSPPLAVADPRWCRSCLLSSIGGVILAAMDVNIFPQIGFVVLVGPRVQGTRSTVIGEGCHRATM